MAEGVIPRAKAVCSGPTPWPRNFNARSSVEESVMEFIGGGERREGISKFKGRREKFKTGTVKRLKV
jgi:hypothetical protein